MIVLDTTILVYALGSEHPLRAPCRDVLDAVGGGIVKATTTVEVIQELAHVRGRRTSRGEAAARAADMATLLTPLLRPDEADLRRGLALFVEHPRLGAFDAVLAATALGRAHLRAVLSADAAFASVPGLLHVTPAEGVVTHLAGM